MLSAYCLLQTCSPSFFWSAWLSLLSALPPTSTAVYFSSYASDEPPHLIYRVEWMSSPSSQSQHMDTGLPSLPLKQAYDCGLGFSSLPWVSRPSTVMTNFCRQCLFRLTLHDITAFPLVFLCLLVSFWAGFPSFLKCISHWVGRLLRLYLNAVSPHTVVFLSASSGLSVTRAPGWPAAAVVALLPSPWILIATSSLEIPFCPVLG